MKEVLLISNCHYIGAVYPFKPNSSVLFIVRVKLGAVHFLLSRSLFEPNSWVNPAVEEIDDQVNDEDEDDDRNDKQLNNGIVTVEDNGNESLAEAGDIEHCFYHDGTGD